MKEESKTGGNARLLILAAAMLLILFAGAVPLWRYYYWREYNRVRNELEQIGTVEIIETWVHKDISLEDFGVAVRSPKGREFELNFWEMNDRSVLFKRADGVVLESGTDERLFDFGDNSVFKKHGGLSISNARELVENIDDVLDIMENHSDEAKEVTEEKMKTYIYIEYPYDRDDLPVPRELVTPPEG